MKKIRSGDLFSAFIYLISFLKLVTGRGYFEIADLINNTIGGLIGIMICSIIQKRSCNAAEKDKIDGE